MRSRSRRDCSTPLVGLAATPGLCPTLVPAQNLGVAVGSRVPGGHRGATVVVGGRDPRPRPPLTPPPRRGRSTGGDEGEVAKVRRAVEPASWNRRRSWMCGSSCPCSSSWWSGRAGWPTQPRCQAARFSVAAARGAAPSPVSPSLLPASPSAPRRPAALRVVAVLASGLRRPAQHDPHRQERNHGRGETRRRGRRLDAL